MSAHFPTVALIGKPDAERIAETLSELHRYLVQRGLRTLVERDCAEFVAGLVAETGSFAEIGEQCDLAIVIGGDGTLLTAARYLAQFDIPLIGVNLGRLGFLVDISPSEVVARLGEILDGRYSAEERFILRAKVYRQGQVVYQQTAINEVVVHSWNRASMIEIETYIDGVFLNSQRSDGMIVSTPTGSTAYALSAGGPILSPTLKAIVLAPINPHALSNRPIVVADESIIEIAFRPSKQFKAQVVCDNVSIPNIEISDRIEIRKEAKPFRILHPLNYDFFGILRAKLNWSSGYR
ncbi:NAD+ kinase [Methylomagnum ishizawai]|uniref:NAD kinase n=1 Tax=Methylomagnum ishizawai TaxID=1760988 RepID=A0A1Y6D0X0_9GAMM|nr:NAD(+) kinase [Methylomagnum ishizawai]SMF96236.1 NAD+ kinase [Methylomagnum ishizawai]